MRRRLCDGFIQFKVIESIEQTPDLRQLSLIETAIIKFQHDNGINRETRLTSTVNKLNSRLLPPQIIDEDIRI